MCRISAVRSRKPPRPRSRKPTASPRKSDTTIFMNVDPEAVLAALRRARGQGLTLKQLGSELHLSGQARQPLRKALAQLVSAGRAVSDGERYRESQKPARKSPAAMVEGARARREKGPQQPPV